MAVGKLGIRRVPGKESRLVLDSTAPGLNPGVNIKEKAFNPGLGDLQELRRSSPHEDWTGFMLDVKAAHKRIKLHESEHGLRMFRVGEKLFHYTVCHFGRRFSAYWWARTGALIHRLLHHAIFIKHGGFLFVDDSLWCFPRGSAPHPGFFRFSPPHGAGMPDQLEQARLRRRPCMDRLAT